MGYSKKWLVLIGILMIALVSWRASLEPRLIPYTTFKDYANGTKLFLRRNLAYLKVNIKSTRFDIAKEASSLTSFKRIIHNHNASVPANQKAAPNITINTDNIRRLTCIQKVCAQYPELYRNTGISLKRLYQSLYVDEKHKMIYCAVAKVGCTNWIRTMARMGGRVSEKEAATMNVWTHLSKFVKSLDTYSPEKQQRC